MEPTTMSEKDLKYIKSTLKELRSFILGKHDRVTKDIRRGIDRIDIIIDQALDSMQKAAEKDS